MMKLTTQLAGRFNEVLLTGTWIAGTNLKAQLADVSWHEAIHKTGTLNTIAALSFHIQYYISGVANVLEGGTLDIRDQFSFDAPPVHAEEDWEVLKARIWQQAERMIRALEKMPEEKLQEAFVKEEYGNYLRNLDGILEHSYYHLGQIVLLKKLIRETF